MGNAIAKLFKGKDCRILMLGLDGAGKTTILFQLKLKKSVKTIPTVGFNVETVKYNKLEFMIWDVGGQHTLRPLWRHYYPGTQGLIYVIDSEDAQRLDESVSELERMLGERELIGAKILVLANKKDLPNAMDVNQIKQKLCTISVLQDRQWHVESVSAMTGDGIFTAMDWLAAVIKEKPLKKKAAKS